MQDSFGFSTKDIEKKKTVCYIYNSVSKRCYELEVEIWPSRSRESTSGF